MSCGGHQAGALSMLEHAPTASASVTTMGSVGWRLARSKAVSAVCSAPRLVATEVMALRRTGFCASMAAAKQLAPSVSAVMRVVSCQPCRSSPSSSPHSSPPPPTLATMPPGRTPASASSSMIDE